MNKETKDGISLALGAYGLWAVAPIYFKWVSDIDAIAILSHRVIWSFVLVMMLIFLLRRWQPVVQALANRRTRRGLILSTLLIGGNWGVFIWAVNNNHMLSASLGYYINPLFNILLGFLFFKDRLDPIKKMAAIMCLVAVSIEIYHFGELPWVALALAISFGLYGLIRKTIAVDSFVGMTIETGLLLPMSIGYLWLVPSATPAAETDAWLYLKLFLAGPITMAPLLCFAGAANRISLTALGFFQYIGPSGMFLLAIFVYGEPLSSEKLLTFVVIWSALALIIWDNIRKLRRQKLDQQKLNQQKAVY
ncbi:EamA family transporter RarD [Reinekea thalattae]|uniref:EamA family transporter RarD n=2 Tax=Reinekea thalattae TaxID=2593301 RepID=A0A5C8ZB27_9GAMM|nr:EamA family transporter RarD [Reinekea thalattae]